MSEAVGGNDEMDTLELLINSINNGATLKEIRGIPDHIMEGLYAYAYEFYRLGRIDDAAVFFKFLCLHDMYNLDYATGMAAVLQKQKNYRQAALFYEIAFPLSENEFSLPLYAARCYMLVKEWESAEEVLMTVINSDAEERFKKMADEYKNKILKMKATSDL